MSLKYFLSAVSGIALGASVAFNVGPSLAQSQNPTESADRAQNMQILDLVLDQVERNYVSDVDVNDVVESAILGAVKSLDPHSAYLPPSEMEGMQTSISGNFGGLGVEITTENDTVKVVSPIDDTPAARAGIQPGDLLVGADGEPLVGLSINEVVTILRGEVGEPVVLTIVREGEAAPFDVEIVRDTIQVEAAKVRMEGDVMVIRVSTFSQATTSDIYEGVSEVMEAHEGDIIGAVIDLRNNPGGLLDQANSVSDAFLNDGIITSIKDRNGEEVVFSAEDGDILEGLPIAVLINQGSASASEIVAGALKDNRRATVVGMRSFGKGSVQSVIPLPNGAGLKMTTALYYTPSGRSIQALGIAPDILVEQPRISAEDETKEEDSMSAFRVSESALRGRISNADIDENTAKVLEQEREELERMRELREEDLQLVEAINAVKAKSIAREN